MNKLLMGVFSHKEHVEEAIEKLESNGLDAKDFSIIVKDELQQIDHTGLAALRESVLLIVPAPERKVSFVRNVFDEYAVSDRKTIAMNRRSNFSAQYKSSHTFSRQEDTQNHFHHFATYGAKGGKSTKRHSGAGRNKNT